MNATTTQNPMDEYVAWFKYLSQSKTWIPKDKPPLPIAEMDATWRYNAANWLVRRAGALAVRFGFGELQFTFMPTVPTVGPFSGAKVSIFDSMGEASQEALEQALEEAHRRRDANPEAWLKTTPLYQALVKDLPDDVAALAKHWSTCDVRTGKAAACSCWKRHLSECPVFDRADISMPCHCNDNSPEWTI